MIFTLEEIEYVFQSGIEALISATPS
jgi:hypothetical protein